MHMHNHTCHTCHACTHARALQFVDEIPAGTILAGETISDTDRADMNRARV